MRHGEIALGVEYAACLRERHDLGHPQIRKAVIIDAEKKYAWGPNRSCVAAWRAGGGGMKAQIYVDGEVEPREWVLSPVDLVGTWTDHLAAAKDRARRDRDRIAAEKKAKREKDALRKRLNANGFDVIGNYGGSHWYVPTEVMIKLMDAVEAK